MSDQIRDPQACLRVPTDHIERGVAESQGLLSALAPAQLDEERRRAASLGLGLSAECEIAYESQGALDACATAAARAGATAAAVAERVNAISATEDAVAAAADLGRGARHGVLVFQGAQALVVQVVRAALSSRLASPGLSPEERRALDADLRRLASPEQSDEQRDAEARRRAERAFGRLKEEADAEAGQADEDTRYAETLAAFQRGEALDLEALAALAAPGTSAAEPPAAASAPRRARRARSPRR